MAYKSKMEIYKFIKYIKKIITGQRNKKHLIHGNYIIIWKAHWKNSAYSIETVNAIL